LRANQLHIDTITTVEGSKAVLGERLYCLLTFMCIELVGQSKQVHGQYPLTMHLFAHSITKKIHFMQAMHCGIGL